ncbi:hypothetical protein [Paraburkholderia humisilvae]|uniref:DUF4148 domain-containing protein n=1 Tax=Paraburkholderia humisilvae TaxID=627669 RepID=A0A6J5D791_9BURK|nr:hypothetical protein [Paraburkholderia humisilvae]CAB3748972.1 hypothetical protein LMG29542_00816 [Paraburkholderia humisilvae]
MKNPPHLWPILLALTLPLAGCATGGGTQTGAHTHLSATQCSDLTAVRNGAPTTRELNKSELAALGEAGYHPALGFDPYYPANLQAAQRQVDLWYQAECPQAQSH